MQTEWEKVVSVEIGGKEIPYLCKNSKNYSELLVRNYKQKKRKIFKAFKEKKSKQHRILCSTQLSFKNERDLRLSQKNKN